MAGRVTGLRLTQANLAALESRLKLEAIPALEEVADRVVELQKQIVHKDTHKLEEDIHKSKVEVDPVKKVASIRIGPGKKTGWRAKFLEFGTRFMDAYPFVRPARSTVRPEVKPRIRKRLKKAVHK